jgi:hypothetical protein
MSAEHNTHVIYRVKATCHIGGLREPGELFRWERFDPCPKHLEEVDSGSCRHDASSGGDVVREAGQRSPGRPRKDAAGPTLEDITAGAVQSRALKTKN